MAILANIAGWNVIARLARGPRPIVAVETAADDSGVIEDTHIPGRCRVAVLAHRRRRGMVEGAPLGPLAIMTGDTCSRDAIMPEVGNGP